MHCSYNAQYMVSTHLQSLWAWFAMCMEETPTATEVHTPVNNIHALQWRMQGVRGVQVYSPLGIWFTSLPGRSFGYKRATDTSNIGPPPNLGPM